MTAPIERVARALKDLDGERIDICRDRARVAIEALRDLPPSITTIDDCDRWRWNCNTCGGPKENWQSFIDAALGEGGE